MKRKRFLFLFLTSAFNFNDLGTRGLDLFFLNPFCGINEGHWNEKKKEKRKSKRKRKRKKKKEKRKKRKKKTRKKEKMKKKKKSFSVGEVK